MLWSCIASVGIAAAASAQCESLFDLIDFGPEEAFAGFGLEVVMDSGATVAMVAGPAYDFGDGIVRVLERQGESWVEVDPIEPSPDYWGGFGTSMDLAGDGQTVVISSPYAFNPLFNSGVVSVHERDPDTGDWVLGEIFVDPEPGVDFNFGAAAAISADGDTIVIGRAHVLGSKGVPLPDAVYVTTRDGDEWSSLTPLSLDGVETTDQFGRALDVSENGTRILVGAPADASVPDPMPAAYVYDLVEGKWTRTATLMEPAKGFTNYGSRLALAGEQILVGDEFKNVVFVYELIEDVWTVIQMLTSPVQVGDGFSESLTVTGETMLIGGPTPPDGVHFSGGVFQYKRSGDGHWKFVSHSASTMPIGFGGYGYSTAIDATGEQWIVGAPFEETEPEGAGRAYVVDSVIAGASFDADPSASPGVITVTFPGGDPQPVPVSLIGPLLAFLAGCEDVDALSLAGASMTTVEESIEVQLPNGTPVVFSEALITVEAQSDSALLDDEGEGVLMGTVLRLQGKVKIGALPAVDLSDIDLVEPIGVALSGGGDEPMSMGLADVAHTLVVDLGLGDDNPTIDFEATVESFESEGCVADCNGDGELNVLDFVCFQTAWVAQDPVADCDANGAYNVLDFVCYQLLFVMGCP